MRDVTIATFCSSRHQDPGQGVLWKFWKCTKVKQENKGGAPSVLKCNNPADLEALNSLILKKVSSRVYWSKYHFNLNNSQVISLKGVPNVYTEQMKLNQRSLSSDVTAVDNYSEVDLQNLFAFLAALAALGLPWSLTYLLTVTFIVLDSKPSSLPDQTGNLTKLRGDRNLAKLMGVMRKHELPNKKTTTKTNTKTMTNTFREHLQRAIFGTFDH